MSTDEPVLLADVISAGFMRSSERHPVVRAGEREEIAPHVRAAVWLRDHGRCAMCPTKEDQPDEPMHLDHIVPWSAGGSDESSNLRLLCGPHNLDRSNFVDHAGQRSNVTWWCERCFDSDLHEWTYYEDGLVICPVHLQRPRDWCWVQKAYDRMRAAGGPIDWWHMRPPMAILRYRAYCAHCRLPGRTGVLL